MLLLKSRIAASRARSQDMLPSQLTTTELSYIRGSSLIRTPSLWASSVFAAEPPFHGRVGFAGGTEIFGEALTDFIGDLSCGARAFAQLQDCAFDFAPRRKPWHVVGPHPVQLFPGDQGSLEG